MESPSRLAIKLTLLFTVSILLYFGHLSHLSSQESKLTPVTWGYKGNIGPERWGQLDPSFATCAKGKSQSPIDIPVHVIPLTIPLILAYQTTPFSISRMKHTLQVSFPKMAKENLTFNEQPFRLVAIHIHAPSEHLWHGRDFPLELHFVHQNDQGKLLFMGVFAKGGSENPELEKIVSNLPQQIGQQKEIPNANLELEKLIPSNHSYYAYSGSLTKPPCLEGVQWIVLAYPIEVSPAQIVKFRQAFGGVNARPIQSLNGRKIFYSVEQR